MRSCPPNELIVAFHLRAVPGSPGRRTTARSGGGALPALVVSSRGGALPLEGRFAREAALPAAGLFARDGALFVNPGSAGPRRFRLPVSVALLEIANGRVTARLVTLDV